MCDSTQRKKELFSLDCFKESTKLDMGLHTFIVAAPQPARFPFSWFQLLAVKKY
jgi:hypothetical protein